MSEPRYHLATIHVTARLRRAVKEHRAGRDHPKGLPNFYLRQSLLRLESARESGMHWVYRLDPGPGGTHICTCGLLMDDQPKDVLAVPGHLDPSSGMVTELLLGPAPDGSTSGAYRAHCQECEWDHVAPTMGTTRRATTEHAALH